MTYESKFDFARDNPHFEVICGTQDRALWLRNRRRYLGASDAAAILGVNPWSSALDVYAAHIVPEDGDSPSEPAYWGLKKQPMLLTEFTRRTSRKCEMWEELIVSKERPWQSCTMDGVQVFGVKPGPGLPTGAYDGGVEVKCTRLSWKWTDGLPDYVNAQIQHQYSVTGFETISVVVFFNGDEYYQKDVQRDDDYIANLNKVESEFMDRLASFNPPAPDDSEASRNALARLYRQDNGERIVFPPEFTELDSKLLGLKDEHKEIGNAIRGYENQIKAELKDATSGICSDGTIYTLKVQTRKAHEVAESCFRQLRRKGGKL